MRKLLPSLLALLLVGLAAPVWAQTGAKVLFDSLHAQTAGNADWVLDEDTCGTAQRFPTPASSGITASTPETYWGGAFSAFGVDLVKKNFQVESLPKGGRISYGDTTNAQDLSNYKVFIVPEPNVLLTAAEKSAIIAFVRNGGGLFLIVDHAGSDRNSDGADSTVVGNDLMAGASWGIHLQTGTEADDWFDNAPDSNYTTDAASPIVRGAFGSASAGKGLGLFGSTSMTLNPTQNATVKGHIWMTSGTVGSNSRVTFATSTDTNGRIAVIGDSSPAEDPTNGCSHTTHDGWTSSLYDNALIHLNAVAWLAGAGGGTTDTTAPSTPGGLSATAVSASQINLGWSASTDNVGVLDYDVFRSSGGSAFSVVGSTTGTSYSDTGLAASTTYSYQVKANDAAGNASAASTTASATTAAGGTVGKVIINEILANELGSTTAGEFVELVNAGGTAVTIGGWTITVGTTLRHTFAAGTSLAAGKAIVVYAGASAIPAGLTNAVAASTGSLVLGNSGGTVVVKSGTTTMDSFTYTSSLSGTDGVSMNRSPDASATGTFVLHTTLSSLLSSGGNRVSGTAF
jgi:chitodextrinase